jgi:hypothetical protein
MISWLLIAPCCVASSEPVFATDSADRGEMLCMHCQVADCDAVAVEDLQDVWNSIQADVSAGATPCRWLAGHLNGHAVLGRQLEACCVLG